MGKAVFLALAGLTVITFAVLDFKMASDKKPGFQTEVKAPLASIPPIKEEFTASFEIYTNGTKRVFTQTMYHNQSSDVFIESQDPSVIYVKKPSVTWDNFFKTLPFSLTKDCLITGTKQEFCNTKSKRLNFLLNGQNTPNALDLEIQSGDKLIITYGE